MKVGLLRSAVFLQYIFIVVALLSGCSFTPLGSPKAAAAKDGVNSVRQVTVYLIASTSNGFMPDIRDRTITAEAVTTSTKIRAEARKTVEGITTVVIGSSCNELTLDYPDVQECSEVETAVRLYSEVEATAKTDSEGFAVLTLPPTDYRISMQTWQTAEDPKCSWSGSEILPKNSRVLELPMLVYCE